MSIARIREQIARYPKPKVGFITVPDARCLQARVTRNKRTWSRTFSFIRYDESIAAAYRAARSYLNALQDELPPSRQTRKASSPRKQTDLPPGVSISSRLDRRNGNSYTAVMVYWHDGARPRNKTFHLGRTDIIDPRDHRHVIGVAVAFRRAYELARESGRAFDPTPWADWRGRLPQDVQNRLGSPADRSSERRALSF